MKQIVVDSVMIFLSLHGHSYIHISMEHCRLLWNGIEGDRICYIGIGIEGDGR